MLQGCAHLSRQERLHSGGALVGCHDPAATSCAAAAAAGGVCVGGGAGLHSSGNQPPCTAPLAAWRAFSPLSQVRGA
jgi:hypothetical protein